MKNLVIEYALEDYRDQIRSRLPKVHDEHRLEEILSHAEEMLAETYRPDLTRKELMRLLELKIGKPVKVAKIVLGLNSNLKKVRVGLYLNAFFLLLVPISWLLLMSFPEETARMISWNPLRSAWLAIIPALVALAFASYWRSRASTLKMSALIPSLFALLVGFGAFVKIGIKEIDPIERMMQRQDFHSIEKRMQDEREIFAALHKRLKSLAPEMDQSPMAIQKRKELYQWIKDHEGFFFIDKQKDFDVLEFNRIDFNGLISVSLSSDYGSLSQTRRINNLQINVENARVASQTQDWMLEEIKDRKMRPKEFRSIRTMSLIFAIGTLVCFTLNILVFQLMTFSWSRWHLRRRVLV